MPLRSETIWLDWDSAVSICGHSVDVKQTYENFLLSDHRPDLFVDVGANYGTHSLIFLVNGVNTVSFEPIKRCHAKFHELCEMNRVSGHMEGVALGANVGRVKIWYPGRDTWLGSTDVSRLPLGDGNLCVDDVQQDTLDLHLSELKGGVVLMKIDAEGSELAILEGGHKAFRKIRPATIIESHPGDEARDGMYNFFDNFGYKICLLPYHPNDNGIGLSREAFLGSTRHNFIAVLRTEGRTGEH